MKYWLRSSLQDRYCQNGWSYYAVSQPLRSATSTASRWIAQWQHSSPLLCTLLWIDWYALVFTAHHQLLLPTKKQKAFWRHAPGAAVGGGPWGPYPPASTCDCGNCAERWLCQSGFLWPHRPPQFLDPLDKNSRRYPCYALRTSTLRHRVGILSELITAWAMQQHMGVTQDSTWITCMQTAAAQHSTQHDGYRVVQKLGNWQS